MGQIPSCNWCGALLLDEDATVCKKCRQITDKGNRWMVPN